MNVEIENPNLAGVMIRDLPGRREMGVIISRIQYAGESDVKPAHGETLVNPGDALLAVGTAEALAKFRLIVGRESGRDLMKAPGAVISRRVIVTRTGILGRSMRQLGLNQLYGVTITRVTRADIEMPTIPDLRLQFGDVLQVVGDEASIERVAAALGNSFKELNHTNFISVFIGIALGVVVGSIPFHIPGMHTPVTLGVAGGPLVVAILLSRIGRIGPVVWHMPENANIALRELGITLFLACVGLKAGAHFLEILVRGDGLHWMAYGAVITLAPLLIVGWLGRAVFKLNFMNLCGLLAGSMTDPPALAFANSIAQSDAPSIAYATVYPLAMLLRILIVQIIVLAFAA
jgi:putative transport protein